MLRRLGAHYRGAYSSAFSIALIIGPALGTTVLQHWGSIVPWLTIGALAALTGLALLALAGRFQEQRHPVIPAGRG